MSTPTPSPAARILLVDDSHLVRAGLQAIFKSGLGTREYIVCGEAATAAEALELASQLKPDLVLLDIRLPDGHGYDVCRKIIAKYPDTKVMMLTAFTNDSFVYEAITAGAHGYLMKEIEPENLLASIDEVLAGKSVLSENITEKVVQLMRTGGPTHMESQLKLLSAQETRVLALVAEGQTNKEIAEALTLSDNTVKNYLASVFDKLKIRRRSQAAAIWTEHHRG